MSIQPSRSVERKRRQAHGRDAHEECGHMILIASQAYCLTLWERVPSFPGIAQNS
jgi:hypothetical protein